MEFTELYPIGSNSTLMLLVVLVRNSTTATPPACQSRLGKLLEESRIWMSGPRHPGLLSQPCLFAGCRFCQILHKHGLPAALDSPIRWINYACAAKHSIRLIQLAIPQRWKVWVDILSARLYCARHGEGGIKHFEGDIRYFGVRSSIRRAR